MNKYQECIEKIKTNPKKWLITGVAGFIGSNLLETLLKSNQIVIGLDNFSTGYQSNLDEVKSLVTGRQWGNFSFINGDIRNFNDCKNACNKVDYVLHHAALGSVPRSIKDPISSDDVNSGGFLRILLAAQESSCKKFVFASSSSVYGSHGGLPKKEEFIGSPLSPYAASKQANELYANVFGTVYGVDWIGLRYFNVFGPRQDANGEYSAVIPKWVNGILNGRPISLNGDGSTSRDFCFVDNVVQANILAATSDRSVSKEIINIAVGEKITLHELFNFIFEQVTLRNPQTPECKLSKNDFRPGDILHSLADINKAKTMLGYSPQIKVLEGISSTIDWFLKK
jgi:UDP-N-acetylglucosamine 4-epimerase